MFLIQGTNICSELVRLFCTILCSHPVYCFSCSSMEGILRLPGECPFQNAEAVEFSGDYVTLRSFLSACMGRLKGTTQMRSMEKRPLAQPRAMVSVKPWRFTAVLTLR